MAVIGMLVAMALPSLAGIVDSTHSAKAKHQAQTVAQTYEAARTAGAVFANPTCAGILDALTSPSGVRGGGIFAEMNFRVNLTPEEKAALLNSPALVVVKLPDGQIRLESHPELIP